MLPSGYRYLRFRPLFLSPILESEEETQHLPVKSDSLIAEINNSSVIPKDLSTTSWSESVGAPCVSEDDYPSAKLESTVIEACSGRKLEDVEVLKQKYINSEIQDLPRFLAGCIHHGNWRSRRNNLNLGSQDIKTQLNKLNLKLGASPNHADGERHVEYRCKKYAGPRYNPLDKHKSAEDILYGDFCNTDDYDPELAALFENYMEECDSVTKKHFSDFPSLSENEQENILSKYQKDLDSEHAFLCGFIEGMRQTDNQNRARKCEKIVQGSEFEDNAAKCMAGYKDLICSKQDVTHLSLREWENVRRLEQEQKEMKRKKMMKMNCGNRGKKLRRVRNTNDNTKVVTSLKTDSTENADRYSNKELNSTSSRANFTPSMKEKSVNVNKYRVVDTNHLTDEDKKLIQLAKKKLEHSVFFTQALEDTYVSMIKARLLTSGYKQDGGRKFNSELEESKTNIPKVELKSTIIPFDLDGWTTKSKVSFDQEGVQVSLSEVLHPVESFEKLGSPLWTPPPQLPTIGKQTPACANGPPSKSSDHENNLSGDEDKVRNTSKPKQLGVMGDYKKAAKLVKLRLTKSNDTAGGKASTLLDKSFANVPLSYCANYSIGQNLKSSTMLTTNINLSDKLAQHLKDLSSNPKASVSRHRENNPKVSADQSQNVKPKTESSLLLPQSASSLDVDGPKTQKVGSDSGGSVSKNHDHSANELGQIIPGQQGHIVIKHDSESESFPNISVTSLPNKIPLEDNMKLTKIQEEDKNTLNKGAAVRAATCSSHYMFNKGDPQLLQLKAKPLPLLHKVCTSCGGISESQDDTKGKQKQKSKRKKNAGKTKVDEKICCKTLIKDKWKLDKGCSHSLEASSKDIEKHSWKRARDISQNESMPSKTSLVISPRTQQKSEEMSINFMNKSIKFRFQCDVSVESNEDNEGNKTNKWLNDLSTPSGKDRLQCPVATETRIYKDRLRRNASDREETTPQTPASSPYLDYCKIKADKIAKRQEALCETTEFLSDTCLTNDVYTQAAKKAKRFPVIPIKKSRDSPRTVRAQLSSRNSGSSRPNSNCDLLIESTKPSRLPCMKSLPNNIPIENVNNNV